MARRIEIELTSSRPDGSWTWRAAGALQPRGVLDGSLLDPGAKAGDVLRADAEFEIEGITIIAVLPPKERHRSEPERIELLAPSRAEPPVTTQLTGRSERRRDDGGRRDGRPARAGGRRDRADGPPRERAGSRPGPDRPSERLPRAERSPASGEPSREPRRRGRLGEGRPSEGRPTEGRPGAGHRPAAAPDDAARDQAKPSRRLNPANTHRRAVLESLAPEERPVADQVLRGGIPAVRTAIHLEREKAEAEGRPAPHAESLLALAESLLPRLKAAEWRDRAEAVAKAGDEVALRDLRSAVAGANLARDDETRQLAATLRESLERRLGALRDEWVGEITHHLDEGRVVRALRLAGRPPEASSRLDEDLATRLGEAAGTAMAPDTPPDRWGALLDAVVASPVRRSVKPAGLPSEPGPALLNSARQQVGRVPALAAMLGISMPPPPRPAAPTDRPPRPAAPTDRPPRRRSPRPARPEPHAAPTDAPAPEQPTAGSPAAGSPAPEPEVASPAPEAAVEPEPALEPEAAPPEAAAEPEPEAAPPVPEAAAEPEALPAPEPPAPAGEREDAELR